MEVDDRRLENLEKAVYQTRDICLAQQAKEPEKERRMSGVEKQIAGLDEDVKSAAKQINYWRGSVAVIAAIGMIGVGMAYKIWGGLMQVGGQLVAGLAAIPEAIKAVRLVSGGGG